jgi:3-hydroxybutyryl-CoA dehydrogenase
VPGLIGNRLQHALRREAISIVEHGIADPKTVDETIKKGFGIRLSVMGPLEDEEWIKECRDGLAARLVRWNREF